MHRLTLCLAAAAAAALITSPAPAATQRQLDACNFKHNPTPQQSIAGCTAHIKSGRWRGAGLGDFYNNRGMAYMKMGDKQHAMEDYDHAIKLGPKNINAYYNRGNLFMQMGEFDRAIANYDRAISINGRVPIFHYNRGNAYNAKRDYKKAIENYTATIRLSPKFGPAYNNRAFAKNSLKDYTGAVEDASLAIKYLSPNSTPAERAIPYGTRAAAYAMRSNYMQNGDRDKAIADVSESIRVNPTRTGYIARQAMYDIGGHPEKALPDIEALIKLDPKDAEAWEKLCLMRTRVGHPEQALAECNHAIELNPHSAFGFGYRAFAYLQMKQYDKALADYDEALKIARYVPGQPIDESYAELIYARGLARLRKGDALGSADDMIAAKKINPKIVDYYAHYGI